MTRNEIELQAKLITSMFSYRNGYSTPEDAYKSAAEWTLAQVSDWVERVKKESIASSDKPSDFDNGFVCALNQVLDYIKLDR